MDRLNLQLQRLLGLASHGAHIIISLSLVLATLLLTAFFFKEILVALNSRSLIESFLHALGILLLLWTMSELILTEIRFLRGEGIDVAMFVEVALVVVIREVIMLPVEKQAPPWPLVLAWVGAALGLGLTLWLVRRAQFQQATRKDADEAP